MYVPLGINYETNSTNDSYWEFRGEYLHFLYGQQTSRLSQVSSNFSDVTNDQEEGSGIKLRAKFYIDSSSGFEGYMDYWDIADSKLDVSGILWSLEIQHQKQVLDIFGSINFKKINLF